MSTMFVAIDNSCMEACEYSVRSAAPCREKCTVVALSRHGVAGVDFGQSGATGMRQGLGVRHGE
jgi:hypothetical protein